MPQGAGLFSKLGGYVAGAARSGAYGVGAARVYGAHYGGRMHAAAGRALGAAGRTAAYGAAAGGLYGATMGDSITGGMAGGATLGLAGRYGRAGMMRMRNYAAGPISGKGLGTAFAGGAIRRAQTDYKGARMRINQGYNKFIGMHGPSRRPTGFR